MENMIPLLIFMLQGLSTTTMKAQFGQGLFCPIDSFNIIGFQPPMWFSLGSVWDCPPLHSHTFVGICVNQNTLSQPSSSCDPSVGDEPNVKVATCMVAYSKHDFWRNYDVPKINDMCNVVVLVIHLGIVKKMVIFMQALQKKYTYIIQRGLCFLPSLGYGEFHVWIERRFITKCWLFCIKHLYCSFMQLNWPIGDSEEANI